MFWQEPLVVLFGADMVSVSTEISNEDFIDGCCFACFDIVCAGDVVFRLQEHLSVEGLEEMRRRLAAVHEDRQLHRPGQRQEPRAG